MLFVLGSGPEPKLLQFGARSRDEIFEYDVMHHTVGS